MCYFYFLMAMNACCKPPPPLFLAFLCIMNSFDMIQELVKGLKRLLQSQVLVCLIN